MRNNKCAKQFLSATLVAKEEGAMNIIVKFFCYLMLVSAMAILLGVAVLRVVVYVDTEAPQNSRIAAAGYALGLVHLEIVPIGVVVQAIGFEWSEENRVASAIEFGLPTTATWEEINKERRAKDRERVRDELAAPVPPPIDLWIFRRYQREHMKYFMRFF